MCRCLTAAKVLPTLLACANELEEACQDVHEGALGLPEAAERSGETAVHTQGVSKEPARCPRRRRE